MELNRRHFISATLASTAGLAAASCVGPSTVANVAVPPPPAAPPSRVEQRPVPRPVPAEPPRELPPLVAEALAALEAHGSQVAFRDRVAVADFTLHSREPRFHLVNIESGRIEWSWLVAHGSGSDPAGTGMLHRFSNRPGSHATSRGAYLTANPYFGKYGLSQRLVGLSPDNDMAMDRAIVIHGAPYVDAALIPRQGRIGRSQGCFAFAPHEVGTVMDRLGQGRLIYAGKLA